MAVIMAATYPDTFAAAGVAAGLEYRAATSEGAAWMAMSLGGPSPAPIARDIVERMGSRRRVVPMMVFHGKWDYVVKPINGDQIARQWATVDDAILQESGASLPGEPARVEQGRVPGGHGYTREIYQASDGRVLIEKVLVDGMSHAWPGGAQGESFTDPRGPDASRLLWEFFRSHRRK